MSDELPTIGVAAVDKTTGAILPPSTNAWLDGRYKVEELVNPGMSMSDIQTVLASVPTGSTVKFLPGTYPVTAALTPMVPGTTLDLVGATIQQVTDLTPAITINNVAGVTVRGGTVLGKGTDWVNSSTVYGATGIQVVGQSDGTTIDSVCVSGFAGTGVRIAKSGLGVSPAHVDVKARLTGPGSPPIVDTTSNYSAGVLIDDAADDINVHASFISKYAQGIVGGDCGRVRIQGNHIYSIVGQHGVYLGSVREISIVGNQIEDVGLEGIKLQIGHSGASLDAEDVVITGNSITRCGSHGIHVTNVTAELTQRSRRVVISNNTVAVSGSAGDGIRLIYGADAVISGNRVSGGRAGFVLQNVYGLSMTGNRSTSATQRGMYIIDSTDLDIAHNRIQDPATAGTVSTNYGIDIQGSTSARISLINNTVVDTGGHMKYGLNIGAGLQATMRFRGNRFVGATDYGANLLTGVRPAEWSQNSCAGGLGATAPRQGSALGYGGANLLLGAAFDPAFATIGQAAWTAGVLFVVKVPLEGGGSIRDIWYQISTAGATLTSGQNLIGIYDANGNLVASSPDQSTAWTSTGNKQTTVSAVTGEQSGFVYAAFLWNGTTAPQLRGVNGSGMGSVGTTASPDFRFATAGTGLTALPATLPALTVATTAPWVGLS